MKFDLADPNHQVALNFLKTFGRRKAYFATDAICFYLTHYSESFGSKHSAFLGSKWNVGLSAPSFQMKAIPKVSVFINFCLTDPRHKIASDALNAIGRRKAHFMADAICFYLSYHRNFDVRDSGRDNLMLEILVEII
ncbi:MAG: hypothetical protein FWE33_07725 [Defluviitaleaceae bacterium]|nr:hypothetical protein [Defluviitaleaceae bacterium]